MSCDGRVEATVCPGLGAPAPHTTTARSGIAVVAGRTIEFIEARVAIEDRGHDTPCWVWQRCLTEKGYAKANVPGFGKNTRVHRASYEVYVGPIPEGLTIDHLCRVKSCVNPAHLEPVTALENTLRAKGWNGEFSREPGKCLRGHDESERNAHGNCRACARMRGKTPEARAKAAAYMRAYSAKRRALGIKYVNPRDRDAYNARRREMRALGRWSS